MKNICDQPLSTAKLFNFDNYAETLAKTIVRRDTETPFVIGIFGEWGTGKTSLMSTVEKIIKNQFFFRDEITDLKGLADKLYDSQDLTAQTLKEHFSEETKVLLAHHDKSKNPDEELEKALINELNRFLMRDECCFEKQRQLTKKFPYSKRDLICDKRVELEAACHIKRSESKYQYPVRTIWFNAWKYDKEDVLWRALLIRILEELKVKNSEEVETKNYPRPLDYRLKLWVLKRIRAVKHEFNDLFNYPSFFVDDLDNQGLIVKLMNPRNELSEYLIKKNSKLKTIIENLDRFEGSNEELNMALEIELNKFITKEDLYEEEIFKQTNLTEKTKRLLQKFQKKCLFRWDKIPGDDNLKLIEFLIQRFGTDWVKKAKIEKTDDNRIIILTYGNEALSLILEDKINKVILKINGVKTDEFIVNMRDGKPHICKNKFNQRDIRFLNKSLLQDAYLEEILNQKIDDLQTSLYRDVYQEEPGNLEINPGKAIKGTIKLGLSVLPALKEPAKTLLKDIDNQGSLEELIGSVQRIKNISCIEKVQFLEQFQQRFEEIIKDYCNRNGERTVIFIDDLDRCLPEKALEILEVIKLFLDVENCVFILGIDNRVVNYIVRNKYKELIEKGDLREEKETKEEMETNKEIETKEEKSRKEFIRITGENYLEKIIQLGFHLPSLSDGNVFELIDDLISKSKIPGFYEKTVYKKMIAKGIENNPRKIIRFFNILEFQRDILQKGAKIDEKTMARLNPLLLEWAIISYYHEDFKKEVGENYWVLGELHKYLHSKVSDKNFSISKKPPDDLPKELNLYWKEKYIEALELIQTFQKEIIQEIPDVNEQTPKLEEIRQVFHLSSITQVKVSVTERAEAQTEKLGRNDVIQKINKRESLKNANLSGANLSELDLSGVDLTYSKLMSSNMEKANLSGAALDGVDLSGADLTKATLNGTSMSEAILSGVNLTEAHVQNSNLKGAILDEAKLNGAILTKSKLTGVKMKGTELNKSELRHCDFENAIFDKETNFFEAYLDWPTLESIGKSSEWKDAKWEPKDYKRLAKIAGMMEPEPEEVKKSDTDIIAYERSSYQSQKNSNKGFEGERMTTKETEEPAAKEDVLDPKKWL